jgi:hypothetical protein
MDKVGHTVIDPGAADKRMRQHPVFLSDHVADQRATQARFDAARGEFPIPPRTAVVFVEE